MKSFKVSNFRLFGEQGADISTNSITVLTGPNSSGKSSYVKALMLFSNFIQGLVNEYRRDGGYDPVKHELDFSDSDLRLGGFSSALNRKAPEGSLMSFSINVAPRISCKGSGYRVTYSFGKPKDNSTLDQGMLKELKIELAEKVFLRAIATPKGQFEAVLLNNNPVLNDFMIFCKYCYLPYCLLRDWDHPETGTWIDEVCDEQGQFSAEKASKTPLGARLAKLQGEKIAVFEYAKYIRLLPDKAFEKYKLLLESDIFEAIEMCEESGLLFYFPVLSQFTNLDKKNSIQLLRKKARMSSALENILYKPEERFRKNVEGIIYDYEHSQFESFVDYYRSLEDYVLENINERNMSIRRWGESFNFIEDHLLRRISVSYDNGGFANRDESETMFSTVYSVLSAWQWAEEEDSDKEYNYDQLWGKDSVFIKRSIGWADSSPYYHSSHILYDAYQDFLRLILIDCLIPEDLVRIQYTSPFTYANRLYSFEEKSLFVSVINDYLRGRAFLNEHKDDFVANKDERYLPDTFLNKWIGENGLNICDSIKFDVPLGLGFSLALKKDGYEELLSDVGHGITQILSILLLIEATLINNEILDFERAKKNESRLPPVAIIGIEEPEVSLHPRFQSLLADILLDAIKLSNQRIQFIVETHSEYMIRKMQALVSKFSEEEFQSNPFSIFYFSSKGEPYDLVFTKSGRFENSFGPGFFDESARLKYILRIQDNKGK